ncbi:DUF4179 domain-containing protein [Evansella sp. AB-rgal1]|uniref:DUF4179 domain-containing protein n=1 Tax=Evansella sp. AB-rgal1 TaxID=3242696 RepID=UPI00359D9734
MNKDWFKRKVEEIEVPKEELFSVIDKGIEIGRKQKKNKKKTKYSLSLLSAAVMIILSSGFVFSPVTSVLASVPIIGSFYENFHRSMGEELEKKDLVTELNQTVTDNGVDVTVTSVYYDGIFFGVTFRASGNELNIEIDDENLSNYEYYLYENGYEDGTVKVSWGGAFYPLQLDGNDYIGAIELEYPDKELPKDFSLPLIFSNIGGIEGEWVFQIPIEQIPPKMRTLGKEYTTKNDTFSFTLTDIIIGETNMAINYETDIPVDVLKLTILDNKGNDLSSDSIRSYDEERAVFLTGIESSTKYLTLYPTDYRNGEVVKLDPLKIEIR